MSAFFKESVASKSEQTEVTALPLSLKADENLHLARSEKSPQLTYRYSPNRPL